MFEERGLRVATVTGFALLSSTLSAFIYYRRDEFREIGTNIVCACLMS